MMIYKPEIIKYLRDKSGVAYFNKSKTEIVTKCPKCEIGDMDKSHGHLYISTDTPVFNCFKCGYKGIVTKLIREYGGEPKDYIIIEDFKYKDKVYKVSYFTDAEYKCPVYDDKDNEMPVEILNNKKKYLRQRLGENVNILKIPGLVLSIKKFLRENNLTGEGESYDKINLDTIEEKYVGFLTTRGRRIILRNCDPLDSNRHYSFTLNREKKFHNDFYGMISGEISPDMNTVVLCEGVFDLLVSYHSDAFKFLRNNTCYWAACLGKSNYLKSLISVLNYRKLPKSNIVILSDKDVNLEFYNKFYRLPVVNDVKIYWNKTGKDFGEYPINPVLYTLEKKERKWKRKGKEIGHIIV